MNLKETNEFVLDLHFPLKVKEVFTGEARYRGLYGGRGSTKSWSFADLSLMRTTAAKTRMLCTRELQNSIKASVLQILIDRIEAHKLTDFFDYGESYCRSKIWDEDFIFKGLRHNYREIKSTEGIDICWVEEAETTSEESFRVLFPTIRKPGSEIWLSWNSESEDSPIHVRFVLDPPPNAKIAKINYIDNPWFPEELEMERQADKKRDPDVYAHVWEGECLTRTNAQVLGGKWRVDEFKMPEEVDGGPYYGVDWGFSSDPLALLRCWIVNNRLFVDYEAGEKGVEIRDTTAEFNKIPGIKKHISRADNARPEMISHMQTEGYRCVAAEKWPGSVEDGVTHLRSYDEIVIHERCEQVAREARLWSYKIDKQTGDVLPVLLDTNNHWMDALRYALSPLIKKKKFTGKPVYSGQFNEIVHTSLEELWPMKRGANLVIGFAAKHNTNCIIIAQFNRNGQLRILDEIFGRDMGVNQFAKAVLQPVLKTKYRGCPYTVVSFRESSNSRTTDSNARLVIDEMEEAGFEVESVNSDLLGRRVEAVRWYFNQLSNGRPSISISPTCKVLLAGLGGGYQFKQLEMQGTNDIRYSTEPEDNQYVLPNQALQYVCQFLRGEFEDNKIKPFVSGYRTY